MRRREFIALLAGAAAGGPVSLTGRLRYRSFASIEAGRVRHEVPPVIQKNWQALIKPKQLQLEPGDDATRFATAVAEPLERGHDLGLRRVLAQLGGERSIPGVADQRVARLGEPRRARGGDRRLRGRGERRAALRRAST